MAYNLELEYLDAGAGIPPTPGISFAGLAVDAGRQIDTVLGQTAGIPDALAGADGQVGPELDGQEVAAFQQQQIAPQLDDAIANLKAQDIGAQFGYGDAALDASGHSLGTLATTTPPDSDPGTQPFNPDAPPDVPGLDTP
jgi:hypothetical protein